jgi:hypothetical protein
MSVSISELRDFAMDGNLGSDIGNVINLTDIGDDMGASLLANTHVSPAPERKSISFNIDGNAQAPRSSGGGGIEILEPLDAIPLDIPLSVDPLAPSSNSGPSISIHRDSAPTNNNLYFNEQTSSASDIHLSAAAPRDPEDERKEKSDLINKLNRLEGKGFTISRRYTMDNTLDEIKQEFDRLTDARKLETSIKFQRQMMMGMVTGLELMNEKFNPLDWQLKGWSESVNENIDDFDEVFEELYDKYKGKGNMPPEARLLFMLAGSGFMFHMSNSFFRSKMPSMDDILRSNPGLQRQFAAAAANAAGPGFGNFMGMAMGGGAPPQQAPVYQPPPIPPTGMFYNNSIPTQMPPQAPQQFMAQEQPRTARREMKGPSGVEDILKTFEEVRRAETEPMFNPFGSGTSPSGMASTGTADQQQPAVSALSEIQSVMTGAEEVSSVGQGRARRRKAQPIGNTVVLNA